MSELDKIYMGEIFISRWDARLPETADTLNQNVSAITPISRKKDDYFLNNRYLSHISIQNKYQSSLILRNND